MTSINLYAAILDIIISFNMSRLELLYFFFKYGQEELKFEIQEHEVRGERFKGIARGEKQFSSKLQLFLVLAVAVTENLREILQTIPVTDCVNAVALGSSLNHVFFNSRSSCSVVSECFTI